MKHVVIGPTSSAAPVVSALRRAGSGDAQVTRATCGGDLHGLTPGSPLTFHLTAGFADLPDWTAMSFRATWLIDRGAEIEVHR